MNGWNATEFFRWVKGKKIAFIGVGVTNTDCIRLFAKKGAEVSVLDRKSREQLGALADEFEQSGIRLVLGDGYLDGLTGYDAVFRAPGMYFHHPALEKARQEGAVITSEMELFFRLCPCKTYAVTGSDGKTTTTTLIAEMLKASGKKVYKGGNIGRALVENFCFEQYGFTLKAAFDINPDLVGKEMHGIVVHDFSTLDEILADIQPDVAVLCVPKAMANDVANEICSVGVKAIWNFTNTELQVKDAEPIIENIHFSDSLLALGYYIAENQDEAEARAAKTKKA